MTLDCGLNHWYSSNDAKTGEGPTEESAYQDAVWKASDVIGTLRRKAKEDCPADCDGGRIIRWSLNVGLPYAWPASKDGEEWWQCVIELSYDVSIFCLSRNARRALGLRASSDRVYRLNPHAPVDDPSQDYGYLDCESGTELALTQDYEELGYGTDAASAVSNAKAAAKKGAAEMLTEWALRFHCADPCRMLLLMDESDAIVISTPTAAPWTAIGSANPTASLLCIRDDETGRDVRERLLRGGFMTEEQAAEFWPAQPRRSG